MNVSVRVGKVELIAVDAKPIDVWATWVE